MTSCDHPISPDNTTSEREFDGEDQACGDTRSIEAIGETPRQQVSQPGYTSESLRMLDSEEGQLNAVFACFGSAVQHAQLFEQSLTRFLMMYNKISSDSASIEDIGRKMTMGELLRKVRKYVAITDDAIEERFSTAVEQRNYLSHRFFLECSSALESTEGRLQLIYYLTRVERILDRSRVTVNSMRIAMCRTVGIEDEWAQDYSS